MYDPKKLEMKKQLLTALKEEGRSRHATRLKHRFAPAPVAPIAASPATPAPDEMGEMPPGMPGAPAEGGEGEMTKEKLIELLSRLG